MPIATSYICEKCYTETSFRENMVQVSRMSVGKTKYFCNKCVLKSGLLDVIILTDNEAISQIKEEF